MQHGMDRADRRTPQRRTEGPQFLADLRRAPRRILLLEADDLRLNDPRQLIGVPQRAATAIGQALEPAVLIAIEDLVAGLARDPELATEHRHLLAVEQAGDKPETLILHVTLLPRHAPPRGQKCHPCARNMVLPISQEGHKANRISYL